MKRAELQKGAVYRYSTGASWRTPTFVLVLETEPWAERPWRYGYRSAEQFRPAQASYDSRNGVLVAETSQGYGGFHLEDRTWKPAIVQLRGIQKLVCPADGDLAATFRKLETQRRLANAQRDEAERLRAERYSALTARVEALIDNLGLTKTNSYITRVQEGMAKPEVDREGASAQVTLRVEDLEKLLAQLTERDRDLHQLEGV
jgi:hypothetical protein